MTLAGLLSSMTSSQCHVFTIRKVFSCALIEYPAVFDQNAIARRARVAVRVRLARYAVRTAGALVAGVAPRGARRARRASVGVVVVPTRGAAHTSRLASKCVKCVTS